MWRKRNSSALFVGIQTDAATVENSMDVSQKIKNITILWPSNSTSVYLSKDIQNNNLKKIYIPTFTAALFTIAKKWKQPKCPLIDEWINKMWYI